jgi:hypothetical protein
MMSIQCSACNVSDNDFLHLKKLRPILAGKNRFLLHWISILYFYSNKWMEKTPSRETNGHSASQGNLEPEGSVSCSQEPATGH